DGCRIVAAVAALWRGRFRLNIVAVAAMGGGRFQFPGLAKGIRLSFTKAPPGKGGMVGGRDGGVCPKRFGGIGGNPFARYRVVKVREEMWCGHISSGKSVTQNRCSNQVRIFKRESGQRPATS